MILRYSSFQMHHAVPSFFFSLVSYLSLHPHTDCKVQTEPPVSVTQDSMANPKSDLSTELNVYVAPKVTSRLASNLFRQNSVIGFSFLGDTACEVYETPIDAMMERLIDACIVTARCDGRGRKIVEEFPTTDGCKVPSSTEAMWKAVVQDTLKEFDTEWDVENTELNLSLDDVDTETRTHLEILGSMMRDIEFLKAEEPGESEGGGSGGTAQCSE